MESSILIAPNLEKHKGYSRKVSAKVSLLNEKIKYGYEVSSFQSRGTGIKTLLKMTGRLTDLEGLYVVYSTSGQPLIVGESLKVLQDLQKLSRAARVKDRAALRSLANFYGFENYKMGKELLLATKVNWLEVTDKVLRTMIKSVLAKSAVHVHGDR